jgi:hypothetical protein
MPSSLLQIALQLERIDSSSRCIMVKLELPDIVIFVVFCADIEFDTANKLIMANKLLKP